MRVPSRFVSWPIVGVGGLTGKITMAAEDANLKPRSRIQNGGAHQRGHSGLVNIRLGQYKGKSRSEREAGDPYYLGKNAGAKRTSLRHCAIPVLGGGS